MTTNCRGLKRRWPNKRKIQPVRKEKLLTAFNWIGGDLKWHKVTFRLRNMNTKHQTHTGVFSSNVRLTIPQLYVSISQLQDSYTVNPVGCKTKQIEIKERKRGIRYSVAVLMFTTLSQTAISQCNLSLFPLLPFYQEFWVTKVVTFKLKIAFSANFEIHSTTNL